MLTRPPVGEELCANQVRSQRTWQHPVAEHEERDGEALRRAVSAASSRSRAHAGHVCARPAPASSSWFSSVPRCSPSASTEAFRNGSTQRRAILRLRLAACVAIAHLRRVLYLYSRCCLETLTLCNVRREAAQGEPKAPRLELDVPRLPHDAATRRVRPLVQLTNFAMRFADVQAADAAAVRAARGNARHDID